MGNICRSPTAEAVFAGLIKKQNLDAEFFIDSAGTHSYHIGAQPDKRSMQAAKKRGIEMAHMRARQVAADDFQRFDWLVVMDEANRTNLQNDFPNESHDKVVSMMRFAPDINYDEVPDPYYGEGDGFELVLDLLDQASQGLLDFLTQGNSNSV